MKTLFSLQLYISKGRITEITKSFTEIKRPFFRFGTPALLFTFTNYSQVNDMSKCPLMKGETGNVWRDILKYKVSVFYRESLES